MINDNQIRPDTARRKVMRNSESYFVTRGSPPAAVARFIEFTRSASGDDVIAANGAVPVK